MPKRDLIQFPCEFDLKVVCPAGDNLAEVIGAVVRLHAPDFDAATITIRQSGKGTYHSLTCTIVATSQQQLDNLYRALNDHPQVKFVL